MQTVLEFFKQNKKYPKNLKLIKTYAVNKLIRTANNWKRETDEENGIKYTPLTKEEFYKKLTFDSMTDWEGDEQEIYLNCGDIFLGHVIIIRIKNNKFIYATIGG